MIALNKIIAAVCLINCSIFAMNCDDDNDLADVSFAMQQMHLDDEDPAFRDAYANEHSIAPDPDWFYIQDCYHMVHYSMHGGCGRLPLKEAFEPYVKDDLFDDTFKSRILGNMHSQELQHSDSVYSVAFDPSGARLATGSSDYKAHIFKRADNGTWQREQELQHGHSVVSVAFDPSGARLATGSCDNKARIFKMKDGTWQREQELQHGYSSVLSVAFDPSGALLATGSGNDRKARIFKRADNGTWQRGQELKHGHSVHSVAFDPSGALLATGSNDYKAHIFKRADNGTWEREQELPHGGWVSSVAFNPSGARLATGSRYGGVRIFKMKDGNWQREQELPHARRIKCCGWVSSVAFDPSGALLATGSIDGEARIFKLTDGNWQCIKKLRHGRPVSSVAFDPSGDWLATGSRDRKARIFKLAALKQAEDIWLIPENEKQYDLLLACQIAMQEKKYVHVTDEQWKIFNKLPERMRNALKQFIVTKEQYNRIKTNKKGLLSRLVSFIFKLQAQR